MLKKIYIMIVMEAEKDYNVKMRLLRVLLNFVLKLVVILYSNLLSVATIDRYQLYYYYRQSIVF